ncbi:MAG: ABC transporter substrate-binding protein [Coriobacteriaceae bacterium]|nr:ABC transporter substrate-binding protein [Coriobacteriaceae bacterium]
MKKYRKVIIAGVCLALAFCFGAALVGCGEETTVTEDTEATEAEQAATDTAATEIDTSQFKLVKDGTLTIVSALDNMPVEYEVDGEPAGLSVDMMKEVCNRLGLECEYAPVVEFPELLDRFEAGDVADVAVSSISITDERAEKVDFTDPYVEGNVTIFVPKDSDLQSADELKGKTLGSKTGTTDEEWTKENYPDEKYIPYDSLLDGIEALGTGEIDAFVFELARPEDNFEGIYEDVRILEQPDATQDYGIAVNKDNTALTEALNTVLAEMHADGSFDELYASWSKKLSEGDYPGVGEVNSEETAIENEKAKEADEAPENSEEVTDYEDDMDK